MSDPVKTVGTSELDLISDATTFYENYWTISDNISESTLRDKANILGLIFKEKVKGKKILEIGVGGEGGIINLLKDENEVHGIDASESARINCEKLGLKVDVFNLDMNAIPFEEDYFDIVVAFEVMEHFANPQFVVEEVKRVLKKTGIFLISTPNPFIHHWPRLFYPPMFEAQYFEEFLVANELEIISKIQVGTNRYATILPNDYSKSHFWIWHCRKMAYDPHIYFKHGLFFWEKVDEHGIRTRPIEAMEMFRKSCHAGRNEIMRSRFYYTLSSLYRFISGEGTVFMEELQYFLSLIKAGEYPGSMIATLLLLLVNLEMRSLHIQEILDPESFDQYMTYLSGFPGSAPYVKMLNDGLSQKQTRIHYTKLLDIFEDSASTPRTDSPLR
jgi:2-polyprenyl-3-methyl-5-hydroxy-6-metoxy-1,4-benzoquinol methylase